MSNKLIIKPKALKGDDGYRTFSVRIKDDVVQQLEDICTKSGHNRNELINIFIKYAIDNCEIDEK